MLGGTRLSELVPGHAATVERITHEGSMRRRLQDIGFTEGARVECVQKSPLGDPVAYQVRGAVIALRFEDSSRVFVREGTL